MDLLQEIHSGIRWILVVVMVLSLIKYVVGMARGAAWERVDRQLMAAVTGLVDLNVLLGLILLVGRGLSEGQWPRYRLEHGFVMILVLVVAHATASWRRKGNDAARFRNHALVLVVMGLLVIVGVSSVGGWL